MFQLQGTLHRFRNAPCYLDIPEPLSVWARCLSALPPFLAVKLLPISPALLQCSLLGSPPRPSGSRIAPSSSLHPPNPVHGLYHTRFRDALCPRLPSCPECELTRSKATSCLSHTPSTQPSGWHALCSIAASRMKGLNSLGQVFRPDTSSLWGLSWALWDVWQHPWLRTTKSQ